MLKLPFDKTLSFGIKPKIKIAILAAPLICMAASLVVSFFFSIYLGSMLGIDVDAPVKDQENGGLFAFLMCFSFLVFAGVAYVIGWILNVFGSLLLLRWPVSKIVSVYGRSEIPRNWRKVPEYR